MKRSPKELDTLADRLQKVVDKHNERAKKNFELYAQECRKQGKQVGQSIDIMEMVKGNENRGNLARACIFTTRRDALQRALTDA